MCCNKQVIGVNFTSCSTSLQTQIAALQNKIIAEDRVVEDKTSGLLSEWDVQRPVQVMNDGEARIRFFSTFIEKY